MPPKVVGPYRVMDTLGSGGVGTVYRAVDRRSGETVALKLLSTGPALNPRAARRLAREFETLAELSHPNVVRVFDTGVHQGYPYLAMELVDGLTLREYLSLVGQAERSAVHRVLLSTQERAALPPRKELQVAEGGGMDANADGDTGDWVGNPFTLSNYADEMPSLEVSGRHVAYESGPGSVRDLADAADEPDTLDAEADAGDDLPFDAKAISGGASSEESIPPPVNMVHLNRPERVVRLKESMLQLCQALSYIHGHGLVHRDLKPSNVMVDEDRQVRLMDFGLAKFLADDASVTADGRLVGTFRYMAPEQILGEPLDPRADLYSLGVILYELLAGRPPFDARTPYELWQKVLETEPPQALSLNRDGDAQMARVAHRLIRKEPDDRYQTAEEVFEALSE